CGTGAMDGSPGTQPAVASRIAALSRTVRVSACSTATPERTSPAGAHELRPRVGFRPTSPQHDEGMRIEPAPSLPCAAGTIPLATAAPDPPDDPPGVREGSHGFRVGPHSAASAVEWLPNS